VTSVAVVNHEGTETSSVELPADIFDVQANIPLMHQVVVAQLAAARQGTHKAKRRGEVSGGGRKPYKQKGTGRARQGSIRAPQFAGGGVVHGPVPRDYSQRTPKKMKAAALRGALSDRARAGQVHVVSELVTGDAPSTKTARKPPVVPAKGPTAEAAAKREEAKTAARERRMETQKRKKAAERKRKLRNSAIVAGIAVLVVVGIVFAFLSSRHSTPAFATLSKAAGCTDVQDTTSLSGTTSRTHLTSEQINAGVTVTYSTSPPSGEGCDTSTDGPASDFGRSLLASGAGGGGFMTFYCPGITKYRVMEVLASLGGHCQPYQFTGHGLTTWTV